MNKKIIKMRAVTMAFVALLVVGLVFINMPNIHRDGINAGQYGMMRAQVREKDPHYPIAPTDQDYTMTVPSLEDRLTFSINEKNKEIGTLFAPNTSMTTDDSGKVSYHGIYDVQKDFGKYDDKGSSDAGLCWAAADSNLIAWYLDGYEKVYGKTSELNGVNRDVYSIFQNFKKSWSTPAEEDEHGNLVHPNIADGAHGYDQAFGMSWYFTGGLPDQKTPPGPVGNGGFLQDLLHQPKGDTWRQIELDATEGVIYGNAEQVFPFAGEYKNIGVKGGNMSNHENFSKTIIEALHYGAATIGVNKDGIGAFAHAVTLWGCDYDVATGLVTKVYLTDSDDQLSDGQIRAIDIKPTRTDGRPGVGMLYEHHHAHGDSTPFTGISDCVVLYAPGVVGQNNLPAYNGENAQITGVTTDMTTGETKVNVSNITEPLEYGYSMTDDVRTVSNWQSTNTFQSLSADNYYFYARVKQSQTHKVGGYSRGYKYCVPVAVSPNSAKVSQISLGSSAINGYSDSAGYNYIWYGQDEYGNPLLWRVLDNHNIDDGNTQGILLFSEKILDNNVIVHKEVAGADYNRYDRSNTMKMARAFQTDNMTALELSGVLNTNTSDREITISDAKAANGDIKDLTFKEKKYLLNEEKVFLLSINDMYNPKYGFDSVEDKEYAHRSNRVATYMNRDSMYWLRSPYKDGMSVAAVDSDGYIRAVNGAFARGFRPAMRLDIAKVSYTMAVNNTVFPSQGLFDLRAVAKSQSADFKVAMLDGSRHFDITQKSVGGKAGGEISLDYQGASVGANEHIAVMLLDKDGNIKYYGRVATPSKSSGNVTFRLPSDLVSGEYALKVFSEQANADKETNHTSNMVDISLSISNDIEPTQPTKDKVYINVTDGVITSHSNATSIEIATGSSITIKANIKDDQEFLHWEVNGKVLSDRGEYTFEVQSSMDIKAVYRDIVEPITHIVHIDFSGSLQDIQVKHGEKIKLSAKPKQGYDFVGWKENGKIISKDIDCEILVDRDRNITAVYKKNGEDKPIPEPDKTPGDDSQIDQDNQDKPTDHEVTPDTGNEQTDSETKPGNQEVNPKPIEPEITPDHTQPNTPNNESISQDNSLSSGAVAGIAVVSVAGVGGIAVAIFFLVKYLRKRG